MTARHCPDCGDTLRVMADHLTCDNADCSLHDSILTVLHDSMETVVENEGADA